MGQVHGQAKRPPRLGLLWISKQRHVTVMVIVIGMERIWLCFVIFFYDLLLACCFRLYMGKGAIHEHVIE